ncbi:SHOCT domain-containing protein [Natronomonas sp. EA1]|uniref:SHOCT domain-containing protein n=1 Tax=Natronomonas sp. EA1 TaxID=3421655 RepID=UPI003EBB0590
MGVVDNARENAEGLFAMLVLGAGFLALFSGQSWFWMVWVVGFAVLLPIFAMLVESDETEPDGEPEATPLEDLKRRYANGELDEEEFERRLERLLETDDESTAREYVERRETERS